MYLLDNGATEEDIRSSVIEEMSTGFYWIPELVECLQYYAANRDRYPTIKSYYPEIVMFFQNYAKNNMDKIDAIFTRK